MNLIRKAISDIRMTIPHEVLNMAYMEDYYRNDYFNQGVRSLDNLIELKTIRARVLVDANIVGGDEIRFSTAGINPRYLDNNNYLYEIPAEKIGWRTILSVLSADYYDMNTIPGNAFNTSPTVFPNQGGELTTGAMKAMNSRSSIPLTGIADCVVEGDNNILVRNQLPGSRIRMFRVIVANDKDLSNINFRSALSFSKLCQFAVKSYIWTNLAVKLDRGFIDRGHEVGAIKAYVDDCRDAEKDYQDYLEEIWQGVATFNNRETYDDILRVMISPSI